MAPSRRRQVGAAGQVEDGWGLLRRSESRTKRGGVRSWRTPAHHVGDGAAMVEASRAQGLEGVIAKRLDSIYEPGRRSGRTI